MEIRAMTLDDLQEVARLERQLFTDPWSKSSFEFELKENPYSSALILEIDQQIAGYAILWKIYQEFHIANLAIGPKFQGKKLGTRFLKEILDRRGDCSYALLEVRESNKNAIHIYEKFGFRTIMNRPNYYRNGETALVMQKIFENRAHADNVE
jgi:ribosomal-protein-alanine N-acetyltransferase